MIFSVQRANVGVESPGAKDFPSEAIEEVDIGKVFNENNTDKSLFKSKIRKGIETNSTNLRILIDFCSILNERFLVESQQMMLLEELQNPD